MRQISLAATMAALLAIVSVAPVVSATTVVEDLKDAFACQNPGYQGTITSAPYFASTDGTGWVGPYYYAYYTVHYENVDRYNHCVAGFQVGAVNVSYGGSSSYAWCVNCLYADSILA